MTRRNDKIAAAIIAILVNALLLTALRLDHPAAKDGEDSEPIQIVFIERSRKTTAMPRVPSVPTPARAVIRERPSIERPSKGAPTAVAELEAPGEPSEPSLTFSERSAPWGPQVPNDGIDESTFKKPLFGSEQDDLEVRRVTSFEMRDSSLLGRMKQIGQSKICGELRAALRDQSTDKDVIVRTMQERGCPV